MSTEPGVEKVLVTGASGYIATHIVQQLQQAGYKVRGTVRSLTNPKKVGPLISKLRQPGNIGQMAIHLLSMSVYLSVCPHAEVLVTGASGYIATHIVQQLQQAGYKVRGTVRSLTNPKKVGPLKELCPNAAHELELVEADLTNEACWKDAVQGCSHVIHTASPFPDKSPKDENIVIKPAVEGTTNVLQACVDVGGVKRVVLTSSVAAISDLTETNTEPITEETWRNMNSPMEDAYGKSKALAEKAAWDFVEKLPAESKFELAVINPSMVLGPVICGVPGTSVEVIRRILERDPPAIPKLNFPVCDVRDVAKAHVVAMTHPDAPGHRHIVSPHNMWFREMADVLREEFRDKGYKPPSMMAPPLLLKMVSWFDSTVKYILPLQGHKTTLSNHRLTEVLGIKPYEPKESLIDMAYTCIDKGFIVRKKQYVNPKTQQTQTTEGASASP
ncbi:dihydroflavonol 4-reductase [Strongylocentrotus purpuratus]|uniref:NAD-dependent epimerase/dehydratase domain-containing protein n=1 Tax=Strongylocentrotus purpuratus TaxID=7668 RepID=A0A7M7PDW2_STRPU|nr:dihydroflavonol 4-reductase [Strongylocentrotus purpuratus]